MEFPGLSPVSPRPSKTLKEELLTPPPGSIEIMFIKGLSIQAGSEPILSILERSAWSSIRGHVLK
jgi:hypothetical protein